MLLNDVNVLLAAHRSEDPHHEEALRLVQALIDGSTKFAWSSFVATAVIRIASNPRIYREPSPVEEAVTFCRLMAESPNAVQVEPGAQFLDQLSAFLQLNKIRGDAVSDAYLAALCSETGCSIVTYDRRFRRLKGVVGLSIEEALASLGLSEN